MPALRTLGLVVLAALVVATFVMGYLYMGALVSARAAKEAAFEVDAAVWAAITTGNPQTIEITLPPDHTLRFDNARVVIDGVAIPQGGYPLPIIGPELWAGTYTLTIVLENNSILVFA